MLVYEKKKPQTETCYLLKMLKMEICDDMAMAASIDDFSSFQTCYVLVCRLDFYLFFFHCFPSAASIVGVLFCRCNRHFHAGLNTSGGKNRFRKQHIGSEFNIYNIYPLALHVTKIQN